MALLPLSDVVNVTVRFEQTASATVDFHALLIIGSTQNVIPPEEQMRLYTSIEAVGHDYGATDPEYQAALAYFSQQPQPTILYIAPVLANEPALTALQRLMGVGNWYAVFFAAQLQNYDITALAALIEAANTPHLFLLNTRDKAVLDPSSTTDMASQLYALKRTRTVMQYSSSSDYAVCSLFGILATVDYAQANTAITLKFKQEPGIAPEQITSAQAQALKAKHVNVYALYAGNNPILQEGLSMGDMYVDERAGIDWLANAVQLSVFNLFYSSRKIPITDAGSGQIHTAIVNALETGVVNGILAPNAIWRGSAVGGLATNAAMPSGYYVYVKSVTDLSEQERKERLASAQVACVLAGAFHQANVIINVER